MTDNGMLDSRLPGNDNAGGGTMRLSVIPAEAGIHYYCKWIPASAGMTKRGGGSGRGGAGMMMRCWMPPPIADVNDNTGRDKKIKAIQSLLFFLLRPWNVWCISLSSLLVMGVYICVVAMLAWPSISCTDRMSAPLINRSVANECRNMCGCTCF